MRNIYTLIFILYFGCSYAQNKQLLYDFAKLPQTIILNPGANLSSKFHVGLPLASGISVGFGSSGFSVKDLFEDNDISFNDKVSNVLDKIDKRDHVILNSQIEVLNAGFRYKKKLYISFGFYQELDGILYNPGDALLLATEGNSNFINKSFNLSHINYKLDLVGVLHFGVSKKINKKLTVGGRFKIYSSALNLQSKNNTGTFTTTEGDNSIFIHQLNNIDVNLRTAGVIENNEYIRDPLTYLKNTFFGRNIGVGLDVGFTKNISRQLEISGSLLDVGFVKYKENVKNSFAQGSFSFEGLNFNFLEQNIDHLELLDNDFRENVQFGDNDNSYIALRPIKFNGSLKYSYKEIRGPSCYYNEDDPKNFYKHAFGAQLYSVFRPLGRQLALTGFYETAFTSKIRSKVTYTLDNYSFFNLGAGISITSGKINFYTLVDNINQFIDIADTNSLSAQLGINFIF